MYLIYYDFGGMASQVMSALACQIVADLKGLRYIHIPGIKDSEKHQQQAWQAFLQWDRYDGTDQTFLEDRLHFVLHFQKFHTVYRMMDFMIKHFEEYVPQQLGIPAQRYTYEIRVHHNSLDLLLFENAPGVVHVILDNDIQLDFTQLENKAVACEKFSKIKDLFKQNLPTHPIVQSMDKQVVHLSLHIRTGDLLADAQGNLFELVKNRQFSRAMRCGKSGIFYRVAQMQLNFFSRFILGFLKKKKVAYKISVDSLEEDSVLIDCLHALGIVDEAEVHIGGDTLDSFVRMAASDILITQSGGFARLAGLFGGGLTIITRNRPGFFPGFATLLSAQSPLFDKQKMWSCQSPSSLFRLKKLVHQVLLEKAP